MKYTLFLFLFWLPWYNVTAQYRAPDLPDDNISGVFYTSPFTLQFSTIIDSIINHSVDGVLLGWNDLNGNWTDTISRFSQTAEPITGGWRCEETSWNMPASSSAWQPHERKTVFKRDHWAAKLDNLPDSTVIEHWDIQTSAWMPQKMIKYFRGNNSYLENRSVFIGDHSIADSVEYFSVDTFWSHLSRHRLFYNYSLNNYVPYDSIVYLFVNDTFCHTIAHVNLSNGGAFFYKRLRYTYFSDVNNYIIDIDEWVPSINGFITLSTKSQLVNNNPAIIIIQIDTSQNYIFKNKWRSTISYSDEWLPEKSIIEYFTSIAQFPDSLTQKVYFYQNGLLASILEQKKEDTFSNWKNVTKWEFAFNTNISLKLSEPKPLFSLSYLENGVFFLRKGGDSINQKATIFVLDIAGNRLKKLEMPQDTLSLDLSSYPAGHYILNLNLANSRQQSVIVSKY